MIYLHSEGFFSITGIDTATSAAPVAASAVVTAVVPREKKLILNSFLN